MKDNEKNTSVIYFSMGCFWRSQSIFKDIEGVVKTEVGYAECIIENPSCNDVFKDVPHKEVVRIEFNQKTTFKDLLKIFFDNHTSDDRVDFPVPSLYRSMVYVENEELKKDYNDYTKVFINQRKLNGNNHPILTKIKLIKNYKKADEHHQEYESKNS